MKKMLFGLITAIATFTGCESDQSASKLPRIDLTATSFTSGQIEIADEIEFIEYVPLELTDESLIADVLDLFHPSGRCLAVRPEREVLALHR